MKKALALLLALTVLMALLAGCQEETPGEGSTGEETEQADTGEEGSGGTGGGQLKEVPREKTVIFENIEGRIPMPDNQNPYTSGQYLDWGLWQANQESLFYYNYESGEIMPWIATGFEFNDDFSAVKIFIREGVKWNDGEPFTPEDIVFTIGMLKENPDLRFSGDMNELVEDVVINGDYEVEFFLTKPNPTFIMDFVAVKVWQTLPIAPKHIWENEDPNTFSNYDLEKGYPVGTGPYKLVRSTETEQVYDLCDTWWGAEVGFADMPEPERAIWVVANSEEIRAAMLTNDELDAAWTVARNNYETAKAKNGNIIAWTEDLPYAYLDPCPVSMAYNNDAFPFNDVDLKWAMNYAVNREEIVNIVFEGLSEPAATMFPTYPPLKAFLDRNEALFQEYDVLTTDLEKSAAIMESKGYTRDKENMWVDENGERITFTIIARSGEAHLIKTGPVLVQQLTQAGFDVDFQPYESAVFYNQVYSGEAICYLTGVLASVDNPYSTFEYYHSRWYEPPGEMTGSKSFRWQNAEYDEYVDTMATLSADDPAFQAAADGALEIWLRELPSMGLAQAYLLTPFNETYWTNWPTADNNYIHPGHWWFTCNIILHNITAVK